MGIPRVPRWEVQQFKPKEDLVEIILVGKRNDDEVYKKLNRLRD